MSIDKKQAGKQLLKAMLEKQSMSDEETLRRFEMACSIDYWKQLNPQLKVCEYLLFDDIEQNPVTATERSELLNKLKVEGYFAPRNPLIKKGIADNMLLAVENLRREGWHELFAFVYDEFWQVVRTPSLIELLSSALGDKFYALPHIVVHYVHPETGSGWSPHVDFYDRDDRFTVWFALSDATIDNGCMYVVAGHKIDDDLLQKWIKTEDLNHKEVKKLLQATRALPVAAGSILAWEGNIIHWGTISSPKVKPRVSLSAVYLRDRAEPMADEFPLLSPTLVPRFEQRMYAMAKAVHFYKIHVLALNKFGALSDKLMATYKDAAI